MLCYGKSDIGKKRSNNQDSFVLERICENAAVYAVCDGMGGAKGGNVASERAATVISDYIVRSYSPKMNSSAIEKLLRAAVDSANAEVIELAESDPRYEGMGTTAVVALVIDNLAHIVHVGDSRAYLIGDSRIDQLTLDHSMVQMMLAKGEISPEEAKNHPKKNIITRAVGAEKTVMCDYNIALKPDNTALLICTDGLSNTVSDEEIFSVVHDLPPNESIDKLIELANAAGGPDNITAVLIK